MNSWERGVKKTPHQKLKIIQGKKRKGKWTRRGGEREGETEGEKSEKGRSEVAKGGETCGECVTTTMQFSSYTTVIFTFIFNTDFKQEHNHS